MATNMLLIFPELIDDEIYTIQAAVYRYQFTNGRRVVSERNYSTRQKIMFMNRSTVISAVELYHKTCPLKKEAILLEKLRKDYEG